MTADNTATSETNADADHRIPAAVGAEAKSFLLVSVGFLVIALLLGAIAGLQLLVPEFLEGVGFLTYGKVLPMATDLFLYGWLTIGLSGALVYVVTRSGRTEVASPTRLRVALWLMVLGVVVGTVAIAFGFSEGRPYLEYPLWADAILLVGFVLFASVLGPTAKSASVDSGPVRWYAVAAVWWLVIAFVAGNVPAVAGVAGALQSAFFRASIIGLWLGSAGVAVVYFLIPRLAGREAFGPTRLTLLGFWSLAFIWAMTAPAMLTYTAAPDWVETAGAFFSIGLLIPPAVIFTDIVLAMSGRWSAVRSTPVLRFVMLGGGLFALWPIANLALALRASSAVVNYTDWVGAIENLAFHGIFSVWLIAYCYFASPELLDRNASPGLSRVHYYGTVVGLLVWVGAGFTAGVVKGWTWVGTANDALVAQAGVGFSNSLAAVEGLYIARFVGLAIYLLAQLVFVVNLMRSGSAAPFPVDAPGATEVNAELVLTRSVSPAKLRWGSVGLILSAAALVWLIPWASTAGAEASILADTSRDYSGEVADGRQIYLQEGCWYCHTQQVRPIVTDVGLGPVSLLEDFVHESPVLFGVQRIGPDLMHAGSRPETDDPAWLTEYLADPRAQRSYSIMPSYDHLSASDLQALAAYIAGSK